MKNDILKFEPNTPQEISLAYDDGKPVEGNYGPQIMYKLADNRVMFVPPAVREKIQAAKIGKHQPFLICKSETVNGSRTVEWKIGRTQKQAEAAVEPETVPNTKLEHALCTVVAAVHKAREYADKIGFTAMPQFTGEDFRCMANTLLINGREGR